MDRKWIMLFRILRQILWHQTSGPGSGDLYKESSMAIIKDLDNMIEDDRTGAFN